MKIRSVVTASVSFIIFILIGGSWITVVRLLGDGLMRSIVVIALALAFASVFIWSLIAQVRQLLRGDRVVLRLLGVGLDVLLLIAAFGSIYQMLGIIESNVQGTSMTHDIYDCIYFSFVTFTTVGYGDLYPVGLARPLAAIEAMTGYVILALIASTAAAVISPKSKAGREEDADS